MKQGKWKAPSKNGVTLGEKCFQWNVVRTQLLDGWDLHGPEYLLHDWFCPISAIWAPQPYIRRHFVFQKSKNLDFCNSMPLIIYSLKPSPIDSG